MVDRREVAAWRSTARASSASINCRRSVAMISSLARSRRINDCRFAVSKSARQLPNQKPRPAAAKTMSKPSVRKTFRSKGLFETRWKDSVKLPFRRRNVFRATCEALESRPPGGDLETMSTAYLWVKAFHIIGVICWFAGLFYLPRLFVYHSSTADEAGRARFCMMEDKLYRIIMRPSMLISVLFGIALLVLGWSGFHTQAWIWVKVALVVLLLGYHHYCARIVRAFALGAAPHSERFFRIFNEAPALLLIAIVVLVVVKPF